MGFTSAGLAIRQARCRAADQHNALRLRLRRPQDSEPPALKSGFIKSCGCLRRERAIPKMKG